MRAGGAERGRAGLSGVGGAQQGGRGSARAWQRGAPNGPNQRDPQRAPRFFKFNSRSFIFDGRIEALNPVGHRWQVGKLEGSLVPAGRSATLPLQRYMRNVFRSWSRNVC